MKDKYDLESAEMPYLSGTTLKLFVALLESPLRGALISNLFTRRVPVVLHCIDT